MSDPRKFIDDPEIKFLVNDGDYIKKQQRAVNVLKEADFLSQTEDILKPILGQYDAELFKKTIRIYWSFLQQRKFNYKQP